MGPPIANPAGNAANARHAGAILGGRYRLGRLLGEGGMGAVYEAETSERTRVAVKMLHDEMAANPTVVERFLAEGDVCRRLDHPGILRVSDVGHEKGVPYLVMELLQGRALIDYTEHQQKLPTNFAVTVCAGVLYALDYAHRQGIVHRDLKPENVFLVPGPDGQYHTKLLDFGIAKCIDAAGGARRKTATGVLLGTPGYMSPEQVKGARNVDHRADLWAVGVMFYEMVTGATPFPSDGDDPNNIWGLISAVLTKEPVPLARHDPRLAPFDAYIARALTKNLDARYSTAREMSEDLLRIARGEQPKMSASQPPGPYTTEQRQVPINSQGDLPNIPPVAPHSPRVPQHTPVSGHSTDMAIASSTMPTGGKGGSNPAAAAIAAVAATMPSTPSPAPQSPHVYASAGAERQQFSPYSPPVGPANLGATAPAPDLQMQMQHSPSGGPISPVVTPRYGTSPSGFKPPPQPPMQDGGGASYLPWILLGVVLLGGLGAAIAWLL
jgi:eukaryotic-like serine/threonine-protein kinase